ncbi:MAG: hydroxymethylbilane synthase [Candidatus Nealsonbacteria bacterium]|nr:hydroxymethylbilane synthase [Candidatus Nealsonbacteria bacterium]
MSSSSRIRLGTRNSALARWQADWVTGELQQLGVDVELVLIATSGDQQQQGPIGEIGGQGVFTKEIQRALLDGRVDLAVHSLKDLPTDEVPGLCLATVPQRASVADALLCREHGSLDELPEGAVVGTGSLRRHSQLLHARGDLQMKDLRGNVDTRLAKLTSGDYDAIILAEAGLQRLGLADRITQVLDTSIMLPAVGQGALGLETRDDDQATMDWVRKLDDPATHQSVDAERSLLSALQGGCLAPIAALGRVENDVLQLAGRVLSLDGKQMLAATLSGPPSEAVQLGIRLADDLLSQGAAELVSQSRKRT